MILRSLLLGTTFGFGVLAIIKTAITISVTNQELSPQTIFLGILCFIIFFFILDPE